MSSMKLNIYDDMNLLITNDKFYIEPINGRDILVMDRMSGQVSAQVNLATESRLNAIQKEICGVLGIVHLISGKYLLVATLRDLVGIIMSHEIWRLVGYELIPFVKSTLHLSHEQLQDNQTYLAMLQKVLNTPHFYFSYTYDLSHTLQRAHSFAASGALPTVDERFIWNLALLNELRAKSLQKFCLPLVHGFISINSCILNGERFIWSIISRRSRERAGTRFFRRGLDASGAAANYVETEQIVVASNGDRASFVQIRASIPLFWSQTPNLAYAPKPLISNYENHQEACAKHFDRQIQEYGRQVCVNLINQHGPEQPLEAAYRAVVKQLNNNNVRYEAFDFHAECRHMRWHRLNILLDRLAHEMEQFGFYLVRGNEMVRQQTGTFRTNCIDCLDRTNVVQSMLAQRMLLNALKQMNILRDEQTNLANLDTVFKGVWADHADVMSIEYSGTPALKTDFTRTGKRTRQGVMRDGVNSATRYILNNFMDGWRQDAIDLFLANYVVRNGEGSVYQCPLRVDRSWKYLTFPSVLLTALVMFVACLIFATEYNTITLMYMLFWATMSVSTATVIYRHGAEFVDKPKLCCQSNHRAAAAAAAADVAFHAT